MKVKTFLGKQNKLNDYLLTCHHSVKNEVLAMGGFEDVDGDRHGFCKPPLPDK